MAQVEPQLQAALADDPTAGYMIYFSQHADLSAAYALDWGARGRYVVAALQATAERSQARARAYLDAQGADYKSFWIDNVIVVRSSSAVTVQGLLSIPGVAQLRARRFPTLYNPEASPPEDAESAVPMSVESNLTHIGADESWALGYRGQGIVVASIDTGVRYTHDALRAQYRGNLGGTYDHNYNWWDPYGEYVTAPADAHGHGTHTMGIAVGSDGGANQIGVAPGAQWIACRGCNTNDCTDAALLECAEFLTAPWDLSGGTPDPDLRPDVVNSSWGDCSDTYDGWFQGAVDAWLAAGIYPVFSNGNASNCGYTAPPPCGTVGNPARYGNVTGVGSTGHDNGAYASHSNRGPSDIADSLNPNGFPTLKPQVVAPGVSIRSAYAFGDSSYVSMNGTSMSAPHVTGLVALIWGAAPCLVGDYVATESLIESTAMPITSGLPGSCTGEGPGQYPNQSTGWGEIDALAAVEAAAVHCDGGALTGQVTEGGVLNAAGDPLPYAYVEAVTEGALPRSTLADALGTYTLPLSAGTYTVTGSLYGYQTQVVPEVQVTAEATSTLDLALSPAAYHRLAGTVADAATGWPLYATVSVQGWPFDPSPPDDAGWTDPLTGDYGLTLAEGVTYTLSVDAWVAGYRPVTVTVPPLTGDLDLDIDLSADLFACTAPGYKASTTRLASDSFDTLPGFPGGGWAKADTSGDLGDWATSAVTVHPAGTAPHSGTQLAYFNSYTASATNATRLYRTSGVDLTHADIARVTVWVYHDSDYSWADDRLQVQLSTDGGTSWQDVGVPIRRYASDSGWQQHIFDAGAFTGSGMTDVRLGLLGISAFGNDIHIDDVAIETLTCAPIEGGYVVGHVTDANTGLSLNGVAVTTDVGDAAVTTVTPDPVIGDGFYVLFAPSGSHEVTATLAGYGPGVGSVDVIENEAVTLDLALPAARLAVTPVVLQATVPLGNAVTLPLAISDTGGVTLTFALAEEAEAADAAVTERDAPTVGVTEPRGVTLVASGSPAVEHVTGASTWIQGDVALVLDDGTVDDAVGVNSNYAAYQFIWLNRFTPAEADFPFDLERVSIVWPSGEVNAGDAFELAIYEDVGGDGDPSDATHLASFDVTAQVVDGVTWNVYTLTQPVHLAGPGDVLIGVINRYVQSGMSAIAYPAAIDTALSQGRSWIGWWSADPPMPPVLPPDATFETLDTLGLAGNLMVRGSGTKTVTDVVWLSVDPNEGILASGCGLDVQVTMDAGAVPTAGLYTATLKLTSSDPVTPTVEIPVTMTVVARELPLKLILPLIAKQ